MTDLTRGPGLKCFLVWFHKSFAFFLAFFQCIEKFPNTRIQSNKTFRNKTEVCVRSGELFYYYSKGPRNSIHFGLKLHSVYL